MISRIPPRQSREPGIVIVPARNEGSTVESVVRGAKEHMNWETVVVDDASTDNTAQRARAGGAYVVSLPFRLGAWGAVQTGMRYALNSGYRVALTMDADGQHSVYSLEAVSSPVLNGISDVSIGVCPERVSRARQATWRLFKGITGLKLQDVTSGLRAYNEHAMRVLASRDAVMLNYQDIGVLIMLRAAGLQAAEVKVRMAARKNGKSRVYDSWYSVARYLVETFVFSAGNWRPSWHLEDMFIASSERINK